MAHKHGVDGPSEIDRLAALQRLRILDTPPEEAFDRIVRLAGGLFGMPISLISFLDENRQWCKARFGSEAQAFPREIAFCAHTIQGRGAMVIPDLSQDARFASNPLVAGGPKLKFYAGAPLRSGDGFNLGTLSVMDTTPHADFDARKAEVLTDLAALVVERLEARSAAEALREEVLLHEHTQAELVRAVRHREMLLRELHHRVRNNLQAITSIIQVKAALAGPGSPIRPELDAIAERIAVFARIHQQLYTADDLEAVDLGRQLHALVEDLADLHGGTVQARVEVGGGPVQVDQDTAMHVSLLAHELVVNSLKHAYAPGEAGQVRVRLERTDAGGLRLEVRDMGKGGAAPETGARGVGTILVDSIAEQLGATVETDRRCGWTVRVDMPPPDPAGGRTASRPH